MSRRVTARPARNVMPQHARAPSRMVFESVSRVSLGVGVYRSPVTSSRRLLPVSVQVTSVARSLPGWMRRASVSFGLVIRMLVMR